MTTSTPEDRTIPQLATGRLACHTNGGTPLPPPFLPPRPARPSPTLLAILLLVACAAGPRIPGPMASVGQPLPPTTVGSEPIAPIENPPKERISRRRIREENRAGDDRAEAARHYLTHSLGGIRNDCSGLVEAVYARAGEPIRGSTRMFWDRSKATNAISRGPLPHPGDLAFFDNTYDRNGNGRRDDSLTHIAVVLEVDDNGTILLAHGGTSKGRTTLRMNLKFPNEHKNANGDVLNDYLRRRDIDEPSKSPRLAGQLWRGFATLEPPAPASSQRREPKKNRLADVGGVPPKEAS